MEFGENQVSANTMSTLVRQIHEDWQISSWQEKIAHNMALGRLAVSAGAGVYLATACERPWLVGVTVGVAALSDKVDGLLARWGQRIRNGAATKLGIWADQMSDKAMNYLVGAGISVVEHSAGHERGTALTLGSLALMAYRDRQATQLRADAEKRGLSTGSDRWGKYKTAVAMGCLAVGASPLAEYTGVRYGLFAGVTATIGLAYYSLGKLKKRLSPPSDMTSANS